MTAELSSMGPARAAAELEALIDGVLMDPRSGGCGTIDGRFTREHCPDAASWRSELGRAQRRADIEQQLGRLNEERAGAVRAADPGAEALAAYLSAFGISIPSAMLSEWLVLVGVLVGAMDGGNRPPADRESKADKSSDAEAKTEQAQAPTGSSRGRRRLGEAGRTAVEARIVAELERAGGRMRSGSSVRAMARRIGASRGTTFNALATLLAVGVIERIAGNIILTERYQPKRDGAAK